MKNKNLFLGIVLLLFLQVKAQQVNDSYMFNSSLLIKKMLLKENNFTQNKNEKFENSYEGQRFKIIKKMDSTVIIKFYDYRKKKDSLNTTRYVESKEKDIFFFELPLEFLEFSADKIYPIYAGEKFGLVSIPFKLRLGDDDFETSTNIGLNIGFMYRINRRVKDRWILQPNIGIGLADIPLNKSNSDVEAENRTALSFSLGLTLNISKDVNLGMFYGVDKLNKANQSVNWKYQNKRWLGIGINIGFSSKSEDENLQN